MPRHRSRWISLRRADWCTGCGAALPDGARAKWDPIVRSVRCSACAEPAAAAAAPPMVLELVEEPPSSGRGTPLHLRAAASLARLTGRRPPGTPPLEEAVVLAARLEGEGVHLLHDRRLPAGPGVIDHLAIGPGGVTVIGSARTPPALVGDQLAAVRAVLSAAGQDAVEVAGAVWTTGALPGGRERDGVLIDGPRAISRLAARPGALDAVAIERVWLALAARFPRASRTPA